MTLRAENYHMTSILLWWRETNQKKTGEVIEYQERNFLSTVPLQVYKGWRHEMPKM